MTERELFAAYRDGTGCYVDKCACGDEIHAAHGDEPSVGEAIRLHHMSTVHQQWREWQAAVEALKRPTRHRCPCHDEASA